MKKNMHTCLLPTRLRAAGVRLFLNSSAGIE